MFDNRLTLEVLRNAITAGKMVRLGGPAGREVQVVGGLDGSGYVVRYMEHTVEIWRFATSHETTALSLYSVVGQLARSGAVRPPFLGSCTDGMRFVMPAVAKRGIVVHANAPPGHADIARSLIDDQTPTAWPSEAQMEEISASMEIMEEQMRKLNAEWIAEGRKPLFDAERLK